MRETPRILENLRSRQRVVKGPLQDAEACNDLVFLPKYAQHLADPRVVAVAQAMLSSDHVRIAQLHTRPIPADPEEVTSMMELCTDTNLLVLIVQDDMYISPADPTDAARPRDNKGVRYRGADRREWHTDWPHDLIAYGIVCLFELSLPLFLSRLSLV